MVLWYKREREPRNCRLTEPRKVAQPGFFLVFFQKRVVFHPDMENLDEGVPAPIKVRPTVTPDMDNHTHPLLLLDTYPNRRTCG